MVRLRLNLGKKDGSAAAANTTGENDTENENTIDESNTSIQDEDGAEGGQDNQKEESKTAPDSGDQYSQSEVEAEGDGAAESGSEAGTGKQSREGSTPVRGRGRGRGRRGRGRGRGSGAALSSARDTPVKGSPFETDDVDSALEVDNRWRETKTVNGKEYLIEDDELVLEEDPRGEQKIDKNGNLLGGRKFKVPTFTSNSRANKDKLYMLSIDAARAAGFRDSLYFFRRNPLLHKLNCGPVEKDRLIAEGKMHANLKSRQVTMVTARNTFKIMGARFIENGKYITDDYYEDIMLQLGHQPDEPAHVVVYDPDQDTSTLAQPKAAGGGSSGGGSGVGGGKNSKAPLLPSGATDANTTFGSSGASPFKNYDPTNSKKRGPRQGLTESNWISEYAHDIVRHNRAVCTWRNERGTVVSVGNRDDDKETMKRQQEEALVKAAAITNGDDTTRSASSTGEMKAEGEGDDSMMLADDQDQGQAQKQDQDYSTIKSSPVGFYEPHTNLPQVRLTLQPTTATLVRGATLPQIRQHEDDDNANDIDGEDVDGSRSVVISRKRQRLQEARFARNANLASVVTTLQQKELEQNGDEPVIWNGIFDFRGLEPNYL